MANTNTPAFADKSEGGVASPVGGGGGEGGDVRKSVSAPLGAKKTSREMKQNAFRFHAQASVIMTLVQYNLQSNYGFQPLNRASLLCTGAVKN